MCEIQPWFYWHQEVLSLPVVFSQSSLSSSPTKHPVAQPVIMVIVCLLFQLHAYDSGSIFMGTFLLKTLPMQETVVSYLSHVLEHSGIYLDLSSFESKGLSVIHFGGLKAWT